MTDLPRSLGDNRRRPLLGAALGGMVLGLLVLKTVFAGGDDDVTVNGLSAPPTATTTTTTPLAAEPALDALALPPPARDPFGQLVTVPLAGAAGDPAAGAAAAPSPVANAAAAMAAAIQAATQATVPTTPPSTAQPATTQPPATTPPSSAPATIVPPQVPPSTSAPPATLPVDPELEPPLEPGPVPNVSTLRLGTAGITSQLLTNVLNLGLQLLGSPPRAGSSQLGVVSLELLATSRDLTGVERAHLMVDGQRFDPAEGEVFSHGLRLDVEGDCVVVHSDVDRVKMCPVPPTSPALVASPAPGSTPPPAGPS